MRRRPGGSGSQTACLDDPIRRSSQLPTERLQPLGARRAWTAANAIAIHAWSRQVRGRRVGVEFRSQPGRRRFLQLRFSDCARHLAARRGVSESQSGGPHQQRGAGSRRLPGAAADPIRRHLSGVGNTARPAVSLCPGSSLQVLRRLERHHRSAWSRRIWPVVRRHRDRRQVQCAVRRPPQSLRPGRAWLRRDPDRNTERRFETLAAVHGSVGEDEYRRRTAGREAVPYTELLVNVGYKHVGDPSRGLEVQYVDSSRTEPGEFLVGPPQEVKLDLHDQLAFSTGLSLPAFAIMRQQVWFIGEFDYTRYIASGYRSNAWCIP